MKTNRSRRTPSGPRRSDSDVTGRNATVRERASGPTGQKRDREGACMKTNRVGDFQYARSLTLAFPPD
ncbi:MAG: hypothetical protein AB7Q37_09485 [Pyrinomonadaceae bacterium]